jgi:hypothetical protein
LDRSILKLRQPVFDGIGAQMHRIIAARAIAEAFNMNFSYDKIGEFDNQIFNANSVRLSSWNSLLEELFPSFYEESARGIFEVNHKNQRHLALFLKTRISRIGSRRLVHVIDSPHIITNKHSSMLENLDFSDLRSNYWGVKHKRNEVKIVLHIRRGELGLSQFKDRYLSLSYYENILRSIVLNLERLSIPFNISIPVDPGQDSILDANDPKIVDSLRLDSTNPNLIRVDHNRYRIIHEEPTYSKTPYLMRGEWIETGDLWEDFGRFVNSDIFIMSKSSLSYVAAMLNRKGLVLYPEFWHPKLSRWILSDQFEPRLLSSSVHFKRWTSENL